MRLGLPCGKSVYHKYFIWNIAMVYHITTKKNVVWKEISYEERDFKLFYSKKLRFGDEVVVFPELFLHNI